MPRQRDPDTEERILSAAQALWQKGGEKALTIRGIARIAGTNTPTIYRRFKNRHHIVSALVQKVERDLISTVQSSGSAEETCVRYVNFALNRPCEYKLLHANELSQSLRSRGRSAEWTSTTIGNLIRKQLVDRWGKSGPEHKRLSFALWALTHGTATLLMSERMSRTDSREMRAAFDAALDTLICPSALSHNDLWEK